MAREPAPSTVMPSSSSSCPWVRTYVSALRLTVSPLFSEPFLVACPADHRIARERTARAEFAEVRREPVRFIRWLPLIARLTART